MQGPSVEVTLCRDFEIDTGQTISIATTSTASACEPLRTSHLATSCCSSRAMRMWPYSDTSY